MSSILTNQSALVALQTLSSINKSLSKTQDMISTGLEIGSAKDNSAIWGISKVMESDIAGFKAVSDSLSLGECYIRDGRMEPSIDAVLPLEEAAEGIRRIEDREVFGKIIVKP